MTTEIQPLPIPLVSVQRLGSAIINGALTTPQLIFTIPANLRCIVTYFIARSAVTQLHSSTTFSMGFDHGVFNNWAAAGQTGLGSFGANPADCTQISRTFLPSGTKTITKIGTTDQDFGITLAGTLTNNGLFEIDVIGYLFV